MTTARHPREVLQTHARSFRWAAWFLDRAQHDDAAVLYAFCREVDDAVDEARDAGEAELTLARITRGVHDDDGSLSEVLCRRGIRTAAVLHLVDGVASDMGEVRVADDDELLRYCYLVAGSVGVMMCPIIGADDPRALPFAIDLGVAMQLTNIARDVREDAGRGRVYLPETRLRAHGTSQAEVLAGQAPRAGVAAVVRELLELAERYYLSAAAGMRFIPARPRLAIVVAMWLYRAIGRRLLRRYAGDALHGRTYLPWYLKLLLIPLAIGNWLRLLRARPKVHDAMLHRPIVDLTTAVGARSSGSLDAPRPGLPALAEVGAP